MTHRLSARRLWYEFLKAPTLLVLALGYRVRYTGRENIPSKGGVLVVPNHQSHLDPPLVGGGCPRVMNYIARKSLFHFGPFRWLIDSVNAIPIDLEGSRLSGIREALRRLKRGEMVVVFPEGSRTWDGEIGPFQPGFAALAVRSRAAILPVAIEGAFHAWPRQKRFPGLGVIHVHYGRPILPEEFAQYEEAELVAEVERRVREYHAQLRNRTVFAARRDCDCQKALLY